MWPYPRQIRLLADVTLLRRRERWTAQRLRRHQAEALARLRADVYARSPFYRRFHHDLVDAPLERLPVLTPEAFGALRDERISVHSVRECRTSGTTGHPTAIKYDRRGWATILAGFARAREWAGVPPSPFRRLRTAVVGSGNPAHVSSAVARSLDSWWTPMLSLDAGAPLPVLVARLNAWRPDVLVAYPSTAIALAEEQRAGRLRVSQQLTVSVAETLTRKARARLRAAWDCPVADQYTTTEGGCIAAECREGTGLHVQEDLVILEVVDEKNRPVPPGEAGDKLLLTVLFNHATPLIRYELADRVVPAQHACPCGRTFRLLERVEGRHRELLALTSAAGEPVLVHPIALYEVLDALPVRGWSVGFSGGAFTVRLAQGGCAIDEVALVRRLEESLRRRGVVPPPIRVECVSEPDRTAGSKRASPASRSLPESTPSSAVKVEAR